MGSLEGLMEKNRLYISANLFNYIFYPTFYSSLTSVTFCQYAFSSKSVITIQMYPVYMIKCQKKGTSSNVLDKDFSSKRSHKLNLSLNECYSNLVLCSCPQFGKILS